MKWTNKSRKDKASREHIVNSQQNLMLSNSLENSVIISLINITNEKIFFVKESQ